MTAKKGEGDKPLLDSRNPVRDFAGPRAAAGLIGPNGAGQAALFSISTGFIQPNAGWVHCRGRAITSLPPHRISRREPARTFQPPECITDFSSPTLGSRDPGQVKDS